MIDNFRGQSRDKSQLLKPRYSSSPCLIWDQSEFDDELGGKDKVRQPVVQFTSPSQKQVHDSEKMTDIKNGEKWHTAGESRKHRTLHQS